MPSDGLTTPVPSILGPVEYSRLQGDAPVLNVDLGGRPVLRG